MDINWGAVGTGFAGIVGGIWAFIQGKGKRAVVEAQNQAAVSEYRADSVVSDASSR